MKDYIIPYVIGKAGAWRSGIDIYNHSDDEHAVTVKVYRHSNGVAGNTMTKTLSPYGHVVLSPDDLSKNISVVGNESGRAHVIITGPDNLMITPFMWVVDNKNDPVGFGIANVYEDTNLKN